MVPASAAWVYGYHGHGYLVHGVGCMSIEDAGHGISIGCIDACHLQKMPHTASVSTAWVSVPWASGSWYQLHKCLSPPEDATHGIGIGSMGISSMSIGNCHHRTRKRHQHHGHGYRVPPEQDATHGISIGCIGVWFRHQLHGCMGIMAMGIEYHQNRMPHMVSVSTAWVSVP